jgi:hypothetical protein
MIFHSLASLQDNYVAERSSPDIMDENNLSFEPHHFGGQQSSKTATNNHLTGRQQQQTSRVRS